MISYQQGVLGYHLEFDKCIQVKQGLHSPGLCAQGPSHQHSEYFVHVVKDKRTEKNGAECKFQKQYAIDYAAKTAALLQEVADERKTVNEKNVSTTLDNTTDDIQEARDDSGGDDAEEDGENED